VGSARISQAGTITKRFRASRPGVYRLRFTYRRGHHQARQRDLPDPDQQIQARIG